MAPRVARRPVWLVVFLIATVTVLARMPFLMRPLSSDEGGFLMVASQWSKGTSLYGDYWVDRPPLLITLFQLPQLLGGGAVGLRLLGAASAATAVLLAAAVARAAVRMGGRSDRARLVLLAAAATAATFLATPVFGATEVDGELLAVPFVLAGLTASLTAYASPRRTAERWWVAAGGFAVAAAAIKQNMLEVFVAATVLLVVTARADRRRAARSATAFGTGALLCTAALLGWAALHGTTPAGLWGAVVTFRLDALSLIARSHPSTTHARAIDVAGAFVGSGALGLVVAGLAPRGRIHTRPPSPLLSVTAGVLACEAIGVAAGGSYWLHYLVGTVPGLVLAAVLTAWGGRARRITLGVVLGYAGAVACASVIAVVVTPMGAPAGNVVLDRYLVAHERPGDTGVVAFGDPAILEGAHLSSPYPELWSLPVRVRDPRLTELTDVLMGPDAPTWVVVDGASLASWGVDPTLAQPVLDADYRLAHSVDGWRIYHLRTTS